MAYRNSSDSPSPSPTSSSHPSPRLHGASLDIGTDDQDSPQSTPRRLPALLPRNSIQTAGKGGCWTCRVRRKKCDEIREDGSCKTCRRLTIECLGWGPKRPEWLRDKKNVDAYKASIKEQLSRAGLIRGQPRQHSIPVASHTRSAAQPRSSPATNTRSSVPSNAAVCELFKPANDSSYPSNKPTSVIPTPTPSFETIPNATYDPFDPSTSFFYQASLPGPALPTHILLPETLNDGTYDFSAHPDDSMVYIDPTAAIVHTSESVHEELVMYYFSSVRKAHFLFAGDLFTNITLSAVVSEPRGPASLAACALADLHMKQMRISHGLEAPSSTDSFATNYFLQEALYKLESNKTNNNGIYTEDEAVAAVLLVGLSQLSGGASSWESPFNVLVHWLLQTKLHLADDIWATYLSLSMTSQFIVRATLWIDVFASISTLRPPKFLQLWPRFLDGDDHHYWTPADGEFRKLRMDTLTGCPDEAMWAIAEVSNLAHWKVSQLRNGCLSYPELIRRGAVIEQRLRNATPTDTSITDSGPSPTPEQRALVANVFRETALLYLHTVLSNSSPGVPEINSSVDTLVRLFTELAPSDFDRALVFPICLSGCMTNDSSRRDFFKNRIRNLDETMGNLLPTRRLMEAVWQKRDVGGREVDVRETIREQGLMLLLL